MRILQVTPTLARHQWTRTLELYRETLEIKCTCFLGGQRTVSGRRVSDFLTGSITVKVVNYNAFINCHRFRNVKDKSELYKIIEFILPNSK